MKYIKILLVYSGIATIIRVIAEIYRDTWFDEVREYLIFLATLIMFFHIGKNIQNALVRKKYFIYLSIIVVGLIVLNVIAINFPNIRLILIGVNIVSLTILAMLIDIARILINTNEKVGLTLYVTAFIGAAGLVIANALALIPWF